MTRLRAYDTDGFYDEMFAADGQPRPGASLLVQRIASLPAGELLRRQRAAEQALLHLGITFHVYGDVAGTERIFPFDIMPRIVEAADWAYIERGLKQRIEALNRFIDDIYHDQKIVKDGIVPEYLIRSAVSFLSPCLGLNPPRRVWCHEKSRWMPHSLLWGGKRAARRAATIPAWPTKQVRMPFMI